MDSENEVIFKHTTKHIAHWLNIEFRDQTHRSPILAKIQAAKDHIECPAMSKVSKIPEFIPVEQRAVATNSELLNTYYIDCFGPDSDMYIYDARRHNEKTEEGLDDDEDDFHYDPNQFGQDDFFDGVLLGMHANLASPQYFSN